AARSSSGNGGLLTSADGWRIPWARTIATVGTPTAAEAIITKTRTTRMLLPAAYVLRTTEGRTPRPPLRPRLLQREDEDGRAGRRMLGDLITAEEQTGGGLRLRRLLLDRHLFARLHRGVVPELGLRAVRARVPAAAARDPRADELRLADLARWVATDQLARLRVDALDPVVDVVHRPHVLDLSVGAVVDEHEAALVL